MQNREVVFLCDNTSVMSTAVHGYARSPDLAALSNTLNLALAALKCTPFFEWVSPLANCADIPSRAQGVAEELVRSSTHVFKSRAGQENEVSLFRKS